MGGGLIQVLRQASAFNGAEDEAFLAVQIFQDVFFDFLIRFLIHESGNLIWNRVFATPIGEDGLRDADRGLVGHRDEFGHARVEIHHGYDKTGFLVGRERPKNFHRDDLIWLDGVWNWGAGALCTTVQVVLNILRHPWPGVALGDDPFCQLGRRSGFVVGLLTQEGLAEQLREEEGGLLRELYPYGALVILENFSFHGFQALLPVFVTVGRVRFVLLEVEAVLDVRVSQLILD